MTMYLSRLVWGCALLLLAHSPHAQTGAGSGLSGRVTDTTGASVPGVTVTVSRQELGITRRTTTNEVGNWEARFLSSGAYSLSFEHQGFKTLHRDGVMVTTGQIAAVDAVLHVGDLAEAVEVSADARMVSGHSAAIVRTLDWKELEALPTSARNITQLLAIEPGVSADISELLSNDNASISPSVNGARTTNNSFVFNGIDVTNILCCNSRINGARGSIDAGGGTLSRNIAPAPETLEEVKLQTSLYDASMGRNGGGLFQVVSKSGSNRLRAPATTMSRTTRSWPTTSSSTGQGRRSRFFTATREASPLGGRSSGTASSSHRRPLERGHRRVRGGNLGHLRRRSRQSRRNQSHLERVAPSASSRWLIPHTLGIWRLQL